MRLKTTHLFYVRFREIVVSQKQLTVPFNNNKIISNLEMCLFKIYIFAFFNIKINHSLVDFETLITTYIY